MNKNNQKTNSKSNKIVEFVIKGIAAENEELFLDRLIALFSNNDKALDLLVNGVPIEVSVKDENALMKACIDYCDVIQIEDVAIDNKFDVNVVVKKRITRYFETQEAANKAVDIWAGCSTKTDDHSFSKQFAVKTTLMADDKMMKYIDVRML